MSRGLQASHGAGIELLHVHISILRVGPCATMLGGGSEMVARMWMYADELCCRGAGAAEPTVTGGGGREQS